MPRQLTLADQHSARVPDRGRIDMLVTPRELLHGIHVLAALMRKCRRTDPWQAWIRPDVGRLVDKLRQFLELDQRFRREVCFSSDAVLLFVGGTGAVDGPADRVEATRVTTVHPDQLDPFGQ